MPKQTQPDPTIWRQHFQTLKEEFAVTVPDQLSQPTLYELIDKVDGVLYPLIMSLYPYNTAHAAWRTGKSLVDKRDPEVYRTERLDYLASRKQLASAGRNALTAWLTCDSNLHSWKTNDQGPTYLAVAQCVADMRAADLSMLVAALRQALPALIPPHRRAAWQKYVG